MEHLRHSFYSFHVLLKQWNLSASKARENWGVQSFPHFRKSESTCFYFILHGRLNRSTQAAVVGLFCLTGSDWGKLIALFEKYLSCNPSSMNDKVSPALDYSCACASSANANGPQSAIPLWGLSFCTTHVPWELACRAKVSVWECLCVNG